MCIYSLLFWLYSDCSCVGFIVFCAGLAPVVCLIMPAPLDLLSFRIANFYSLSNLIVLKFAEHIVQYVSLERAYFELMGKACQAKDHATYLRYVFEAENVIRKGKEIRDLRFKLSHRSSAQFF